MALPKTLTVDGFKLRDENGWIIAAVPNPADGEQANLVELAGRYNAYERLEAALRIFAQVADVLDFYVPHVCPDEIHFPGPGIRVDEDGPGRVILSREDFMRARVALAENGGASC